MPEYRHYQHPEATRFFTVNLAEHRNNRQLTERIDLLRAAFAQVKHKHPFQIDAIVVLPEHLHCILTLPEGDTDFSTRWGLVKTYFARHIAKGERISQSRASRSERGLWQRRFWDYLIRDETDYRQHIHYIHWNPVKHGWVRHVKDWPISSFHRYLNQGIYPDNWGTDVVMSYIYEGSKSIVLDAVRAFYAPLGTPHPTYSFKTSNSYDCPHRPIRLRTSRTYPSHLRSARCQSAGEAKRFDRVFGCGTKA